MASNDSRPLIGLTTYLEPTEFGVWQVDAAVLQRSYVDAVLNAGGVPVLLPPAGDRFAELTAPLHGLVLTGGADVDPARYGREPAPATGAPRVERDGFELGLLRTALDRGLPVFAVCRGMQVLNVALGGTLTQHLPDVVAHNGHQPARAVFGDTSVQLAAGSRTAAALGAQSTVCCYHHQSIAELADGLVITGTAQDGTIEAVELPGADHVVGVQWHPEENGSDIRLFRALVDAADRYRGGKAPCRS